MNKLLHTKNLPWIILTAGLSGALLRFFLFAAGLDERGLLAGEQGLEAALWLLSAAAVVFLLLMTRPLRQAPKYAFNFPAGVIPAAGCALAAAGILAAGIRELVHAADLIGALGGILGLLSAASLGFLAWCRWKGRRPAPLFSMVVCIYLMVDLVCLYRQWSGDPQIQDYCFSLLASVGLMLSCYYDAAFAAGSGSRALHTFFHLATVYFCLVSLPRCGDPFFYLTTSIWMFTGLCNLAPMPHVRPAAE